VVGQVLAEAVGAFAELFPGEGEEQSQFNMVLTDGRVMVASRWGHSLSWLERRAASRLPGDGAVGNGVDYRAVAVASEPTSEESWMDLPERSVLQIDADLTAAVVPISA
jgi:hypothetical protein